MPASTDHDDNGNGRITQAVRWANIERDVKEVLVNQGRIDAKLDASLAQQHQRDIALSTLMTRMGTVEDDVDTLEGDVDTLKRQTTTWNSGNSLAAALAGILAFFK